MKFYIATSLGNVAEHHRVRDWLLARGHIITVDWTEMESLKSTDDTMKLAERAYIDLDGVKDADTVIVLLPGGSGTHVELGAAIARRKRVLMFGKHREDYRCVFHYHWMVTYVPDDDPIGFLSRMTMIGEVR